MSKKILIVGGIVLVIVGVLIFTREKTDQQNSTDEQVVKRSSYSYADGNGNIYNLDPVAMTIEYDPITLAESSSGMYSGGKYTKKTITATQYDSVALLLGEAELNTSARIKNRIKGSGAVTVIESGAARDFILDSNASNKIEIEKLLKDLIKN